MKIDNKENALESLVGNHCLKPFDLEMSESTDIDDVLGNRKQTSIC